MLHCDGKIFPEITGGRSRDRIAVLVIGYGHEKLPMELGARQALHVFISFRNSTCPNE